MNWLEGPKMLTTFATALDDFTSVSVNCYLFVASLINTRAHFGRGGGGYILHGFRSLGFTSFSTR